MEPEFVIIYGAGSAGKALAKSLQENERFCPVAFIDDDESLVGGNVLGLNIQKPTEVGDIITEKNASLVLIAIANLEPKRRREILSTLSNSNIAVKSIPSLQDLIAGKPISDFNEIEIEELLNRPPVETSQKLVDEAVQGETIMVTGAGGSIGGELSRIAVKFGAEKIVLYENSEVALYLIQEDLNELKKHLGQKTEIVPILGSVLNEKRVSAAIEKYKVSTIYHAAAYKHVPLVEHNVLVGLENNVLGTLCVLNASKSEHVKQFTFVSTDKAVRPTNVMGATKRFAEILVQDFHKRSGRAATYSMVRFGNVLGSSGSVVPLFKKQIKQGGPITITHKDINRYFMTKEEAANLVVQSGIIASGGEVFVLDMGQPIEILQLARMMVQLSGKSIRDKSNPNGDIEIVFTGLRPGEKLYEELLIDGDVIETINKKIFRAIENSIDPSKVEELIAKVNFAVANEDIELARQALYQAVPEYTAFQKKIDRLHD